MTNKYLDILRRVISDLNEELQYENLENVTEETPIFGDVDGIDSLSLVFLISQTEMLISEELDIDVVLADEKAMSMRSSPYRTVGTLLEFIKSRVEP